METERAAEIGAVIEAKENTVSYLDGQIDKNLIGQIVVKPEELDYVKDFAREGAVSRVKIHDLQAKIKSVESERDHWKRQYNILFEKVKIFLNALTHAPRRVMEFLADILRKPPERSEPERQQERKKSISHEEVR